jgi:hypothetical protein
MEQYERFERTKVVTKSRKSKDRQYTGSMDILYYMYDDIIVRRGLLSASVSYYLHLTIKSSAIYCL